MTESQLNRLVRKAQCGCEYSLGRIYLLFLPEVRRLSDQIWYKVRDVTSFEQACFRRVEYELGRYDPKKSNVGFVRYIHARFQDVRNTYLSRRALHCEETVSLDELLNPTSENTLPFEPVDPTAHVEGEVVTKEMVTLLAKGDHRREMILKAWLQGLTNTSALSTLLAQRFGGNAEAHRRFITRFKDDCQRSLLAKVV